MIETKALTKTIGEKMILRGVNLKVNKGEAVAVLGTNGAGKSTWLKIVAGLLKPSSGEIFLKGQPRKKDDFEQQKVLGYLGHQSFLYDAFSPVENLKFFARLYHISSPDTRINKLIEDVGLAYFKHEPVRSFSRGMIQRLAIARAILHKPEILLLDEPHTGLDQQAVSLFNRLLLDLKAEGVTIIMVTHDFQQISTVCDRAVVLRKGRIAEDELIRGRPVSWIHSLYEGEAATL
ncbi:heme ABC exporter ATP-binding protein CcmA [Salipaludibacillus aurantiacus]|uniref:Heme exporter protein A n=1 Tax=Salipaludibacillus aurantiacus TaxID=1601833 RepID=A0A1H9X7L1_9BACI|nr:heme ABC exporter ATP-binding protein CcmA [Salipaludibacillus aurantiacus]SES42115.1 heme exporter protein A [Salipaludibacillus aurantiacus]